MAVTAAMVKELRERTQAGMMDCKKALTETDGDMEKAIEYLREKGLAKAAKKAGRIASEGLVNFVITDDGKAAAMVEVNSETDFVAKNDEFKDFVATLAKLALEANADSMDAFMASAYPGEGTVADALQNKIAKIGENMNIRRFVRFAKDGVVSVGYLHGGGKIGVIVELETDAAYADVVTVGKDVAMQIAAMNPKYVSEADVDAEYLEHEKKILLQQALNENEALPEDKRKPEAIIEKMLQGRIKKELKEVCLLDQQFVKTTDKQTVEQYVAAAAKALGKNLKVVGMLRYEVGEGIEKKEENFAEEVAKQMGN